MSNTFDEFRVLFIVKEFLNRLIQHNHFTHPGVVAGDERVSDMRQNEFRVVIEGHCPDRSQALPLCSAFTQNA